MEIFSFIFLLIGGLIVLSTGREKKYLFLLCFFVLVSMATPVETRVARVAELFLIFPLALKIQNKCFKELKWYFIFVILSIFSLSYSDNPLRGIPGIAMYISPLFFYYLAYISIKRKSDIFYFFNKISHGTLWLPLLIVFSLLFFGIVNLYYGMAICAIPAALYLKSKKKRYLLFFVLCLLPALIVVKRTPLLGVSASMMIFGSLIYKWKAVIPSLLAVVVAATLVVSIPSFRQKLFFDGEDVSIASIVKDEDFTENLNMNGRDVFWLLLLEKYYSKSPYIGAGTGSVKAYIQSDENEYKDSFLLVHNDWLLILCEMGVIGVIVFLLYFCNLLKRCVIYSSKKYPMELRLISASCAGTAVSIMIHMFFENCLNSFIFIISVILYALFNRAVALYKQS